MRKTRKPTNGMDVEDWKIKFLLTGEEPERHPGSVNPFEALVFCKADPGEPSCRWGRVEPWFNLWERIKGCQTISDYKKKYGSTWAERQLKRKGTKNENRNEEG